MKASSSIIVLRGLLTFPVLNHFLQVLTYI